MRDAALVLGGSGFIGKHLVRQLLADEVEVVLLGRETSQFPEAEGRAKVLRSANWSTDGLLNLLKAERFDSIFNLASYGVNPGHRDPRAMHDINVDLPVSLAFVAAEHGARLVLAGSCAEYAPPLRDEIIAESHPLEMRLLYGSTKAAGGIAASAVAKALGVRATVLRLFNVYGPGEAQHRLLPTLIENLAANRRVPLSEGLQVRDFIYVQDTVEAFLAADRSLASEKGDAMAAVYNVATGTGRSVRDFCAIVGKIVGASPGALGYGDREMRPGEVMRLVGDARAFETDTGWKATTSLEAGLEAAVRSRFRPEKAE